MWKLLSTLLTEKRAPFVGSCPGIAHVIEQRTFHILGKGHAEKLADHPVGHLRFMAGVTLERQAFDDGKAPTGLQTGKCLLQGLLRRRESPHSPRASQ